MRAVRSLVEAYRRAFSGLPRPIWVIAFAGLVNRSGSMVLPFLTLYLTRRLGYPPEVAGWVVGVWGAGSIVGSLAGGWLVDRVGPVRVMQASLLGNMAGFFLLPLAHEWWVLAGLVLATSIVGESLRPAVMASASIAAPPEVRARSLALIRLAHNLGFAVGPAVGGVLATFSYTWLFVVDGGTCGLAALVLGTVFGWRGPRLEHAEEPVGAGPGPWRRPAFVAFLAGTLLLGMVFFQVFSTMPLYLRSVYLLREDQIGALLGLNGVVIVLVEMLLVHRLERYDHLRVAAVGALLIGTGFALLAAGRTLPWAAFTILVWTLGEMTCMPMINAVAASQGGAGESGRYMGAFTLSFSIAFVAGPVAGTAVMGRWGGDVLWVAVGALGPVIAATFWVLAPRLARPSAAGRP